MRPSIEKWHSNNFQEQIYGDEATHYYAQTDECDIVPKFRWSLSAFDFSPRTRLSINETIANRIGNNVKSANSKQKENQIHQRKRNHLRSAQMRTQMNRDRSPSDHTLFT